MSLKLNKFLLELGEYRALFMENFVPFGNVKFALPVSSITSAGPDIVLTTILVSFILEKYLFYLRIVCVFPLSGMHISRIRFLDFAPLAFRSISEIVINVNKRKT